MPNRILKVDVQTRRADPVEAEIWALVTAELMTPETEIRGRIVGPRCDQATTVEVAYALRRFSAKPPNIPELTTRVVIPEPSLWEHDTPFVYDILVELWQDGQCCDRRKIEGFSILKTRKQSPATP